MGFGRNEKTARAERGMGARKKGNLWSLHVWYHALIGKIGDC